MTTGPTRSFKDLRVSAKARQTPPKFFAVSKALPKEAMCSRTDQIRRSARSVGAQITEAWGQRRYAKHAVSKLTDANAEPMETQHWVGKALDSGCLAPSDVTQLNSGLEEIRRRLYSMIEKSDSSCGPFDSALHESPVAYFTSALEARADD
jgi:four helix bundle protein